MGLIARPISAIYDTRHRSYLDHSLAEDNDRASGPMLSRLENSVSRKDIYRLAPVRGASRKNERFWRSKAEYRPRSEDDGSHHGQNLITLALGRGFVKHSG